MKDAAGKARKRRFARLESFRVAADHHQRLPARERHVDKHDTGIGETRPQPRHGAGRDGRSDPDDEPAPRGADDAIPTEQDGFRLVVEADYDDDKIAALRHRAGIGRQSDAGLLRPGARVRVDIVSRHVELGPRKMTGHRMSHLPSPMIPTRRTALVLISRPFSYPPASRIVDASRNFGDKKPPSADSIPTRR